MINPETISLFKKERFLKEMVEDEFRDKVVRPLFFRRGLKDGRDLCGPDEEGKDMYFLDENKLGQTDLYVVQTKSGNLNLASKAAANLVTATTQVNTALKTRIALNTRKKIYPAFAVLCASGKINKAAREYIHNEIKDPRIMFFDAGDLIPIIDEKYPELWFGIDAQKFPYLNKLKDILETQSEATILTDIVATSSKATAATDDMYVPLKLTFTTEQIRKVAGKIVRNPKMISIPIDALLTKDEHLSLILGEAGSGKTTALRRLAYVLCNRPKTHETEIILPILLRAVDVPNDGHKRLVELCAKTSEKLIGEVCFSADDLQNGRVLVMIDALDELADEDKSKYVLDLIKDFLVEYPQCKVIVTSREYKMIQNMDQLGKYNDYRLTNIDLDQAQKMVAKLIKGKALPTEAVQEVVRKLQSVHGIDLNPLLITIFVSTSDVTRKDIPANITELFKKFTEMMLGRWDQSKGISQQYQAPLKDHLLKKLAYEMHTRRVISLSLGECKKIFTDQLEAIGKRDAEIDDLLEEMIYRSGLFRHLDDRLEFRHLLLQEFFAGRGIPSKELIQTYITNPWWQKAIIFYYGQNPNDVASIEGVIQNITTNNAEEQLYASVTVGLALQACYLVPFTNKIEIYKWVVSALAKLKDELVPATSGQYKYPLTRFIHYYLYGRDAVACDVLYENHKEIVESLAVSHPDSMETCQFWICVGLIECGEVDLAKQMLKSFMPGDLRMLLALHLGSFLVAHLRVMTKAQRKTAGEICDLLSPKIVTLRQSVIEEYKSELLEMHQGRIKAIEHK